MAEPLIVLYGATGYTGSLIAQRAKKLGLRLRISGRSPGALARLAAQLGCDYTPADLDDAPALRRLLKGARVLLNAAGPFSYTSAPLMAACVSAGVCYLDVSGEVDALVDAAALDGAARTARVMIMPAVGFDVIPSDCLVRHLSELVPGVCALHIALSGLEHVSRGSARTLLDLVGRPVRARRAGKLVELRPGSTERSVDFGAGARTVCAVDWGDLVTAYFTTGVPNVTTYFAADATLRASLALRHPNARFLRREPFASWLDATIDAWPVGRTVQARAAAHTVLHVSALDAAGAGASMIYQTGDVYSFTAASACEVARRVALGDLEWGFQTPARVYGSELLDVLPGKIAREVAWT